MYVVVWVCHVFPLGVANVQPNKDFDLSLEEGVAST